MMFLYEQKILYAQGNAVITANNSLDLAKVFQGHHRECVLCRFMQWKELRLCTHNHSYKEVTWCNTGHTAETPQIQCTFELSLAITYAQTF